MSSLIQVKPDITFPFADDGFASDEARYRWQMDVRSHYLLLKDKNIPLKIDISKLTPEMLVTQLTWLNSGELIAGSFAGGVVLDADLKPADIDIYFKSLGDATQFREINFRLLPIFSMELGVCSVVVCYGQKFNLIHGVQYDSPEDLISHFDIRACSIAIDPNAQKIYSVKGAIHDCFFKRIVFNPIPHNTTVARLVKYTQKGFDIDAHQRLFFAELIKSDMYNPEIELSTGYRAVAT